MGAKGSGIQEVHRYLIQHYRLANGLVVKGTFSVLDYLVSENPECHPRASRISLPSFLNKILKPEPQVSCMSCRQPPKAQGTERRRFCCSNNGQVGGGAFRSFVCCICLQCLGF